jgi:hypothetical protein
MKKQVRNLKRFFEIGASMRNPTLNVVENGEIVLKNDGGIIEYTYQEPKCVNQFCLMAIELMISEGKNERS